MPDKIIEFLKLTPRYLVALWLPTAVILFAPPQFNQRLGISKFTDDYRFWIGIVFLVTSTLFITHTLTPAFAWIREAMRVHIIAKNMKRYLRGLTEDEKQILRFYIRKETKTNYLRITNGVAQGLVARGIIRRVTDIGDQLEGFAHNICDLAWDYLNEHHTLLDGTTTICKTDSREGLKAKRLTY